LRLFGISRRGAPTLGHAPQKNNDVGRDAAGMQSEKNLSRKLVQITICGAYALINSRTILNHIKAERLFRNRHAERNRLPGARLLAVAQKINRKYFLQE
jgi:hypothetical protein